MSQNHGSGASYGVKLRDPATALEFGIVLREAEAGAIQHARGETWLGALPPLPASLTLRLLALATATIERVVIHRAIWQSWYTTVMLAQGEHHAEIDVQPSEGLALASASGAPIYVRRALLEELGANPDQGARNESADQQFMERLAATVDRAEVLIPAPAPLAEEVQRQVDDRLARLCADTDALHGLVTHNSGRLLAMFGPADKEVLARYSKALILEPLGSQARTELRQYKGLLVDTIFTADAWILFWPWSHGVVHISGFTIHDPDSHLELLKAATQDLATILSEG